MHATEATHYLFEPSAQAGWGGPGAHPVLARHCWHFKDRPPFHRSANAGKSLIVQLNVHIAPTGSPEVHRSTRRFVRTQGRAADATMQNA